MNQQKYSVRSVAHILLIVLIILFAFETNAIAWPGQAVFAASSQQAFHPHPEQFIRSEKPVLIHMKRHEKAFSQSSKRHKVIEAPTEFDWVTFEFGAGGAASVLSTPVLWGAMLLTGMIFQVEGTGSNGLLILFFGVLYPLVISTSVWLTGDLGSKKGSFWQTFAGSLLGDALAALIIIAGVYTATDHIPTGTAPLLATLAFLLPIAGAVIGYNLNFEPQQAAEILQKTEITQQGISYQVLRF